VSRRYDPAMRPVPPPCGKDCPGRTAGCSARCCTWTLYESIRDHIYDANHQGKAALEMNRRANKQMNDAIKGQRRPRLYAAK